MAHSHHYLDSHNIPHATHMKIHPGNFNYKPHHPHHQLLIDQFGVKRESIEDEIVAPLKKRSSNASDYSSDENLPQTLPPQSCSRCYREVDPILDHNPTIKTHLCAGFFFFTHLICCFYTPYAFGWFSVKVKRCPLCHFNMGKAPDRKKSKWNKSGVSGLTSYGRGRPSSRNIEEEMYTEKEEQN